MDHISSRQSERLVSELFRPITLNEFASQYWAKEPLHAKGVISREDLKAMDPREEVGRFLVDERLLLLLEAQLRSADQGARPLLAPPDLNFAQRAGLHLQLRKLEKVLPQNHPIMKIAFSLELFLGHPLDSISTIISPPTSQMIGEHFDLTEIFTVQVDGSKVWSVHSPERDSWFDLELNAGDILYLPARIRHRVVSHNHISVSYALVYRAIKFDAVLAELARNALQGDAENVATLPILGPWSKNSAHEQVPSDLLKRWSDRLAKLDTESVLFAARRLSLSLSTIRARDLNLASTRMTTKIKARLTPGMNAVFDCTGDKIQILIRGGNSLELPGGLALEVAKILKSPRDFTPRDISTVLLPSEVIVLLCAFAQAGLVQFSSGAADRSDQRTWRMTTDSNCTPRFIAHVAAAQA